MEGQPKRLPEAAASFRNTPKTGSPDALAEQHAYIDRILIRQGEPLTDVNRQDLKDKINSIGQHRN